MASTFRSISPSGLRYDNEAIRSGFSVCWIRRVMTTAENSLANTVGTATPATPIFNTKIQKAFPTTLRRFIHSETSMDTLVFPWARKMEMPEL